MAGIPAGMCALSVALLASIAALTPLAAQAQSTVDRIRRSNGVDSGKITAVTPLGVTISKGGVESTVAVEDIQGVTLAGEPAELNAAGQPAGARTEYAKLAKAKSAYFELRSALLLGRAWQAEGDHVKAVAEFDRVLAAAGGGSSIEPLKLAATLDRAVSHAATGKVEESAVVIGQIIAKAAPEDSELLARAYNALGDCYLQSGDAPAALFAFLHVDLLFHQEADAHARALHELIALWKTAGKDSRSQQSAQELAKKYPNSRWAKP